MKKNSTNQKPQVIHEDIDAISVSSTNVYKTDGADEYTVCDWKVVNGIYQDLTTYLLDISTDSDLPLSLYTLCVQGRGQGKSKKVNIVRFKFIKGAPILVKRIKDGAFEPVDAVDGWYEIPACVKGKKTSDGREPADPDSVYFIQLVGNGGKECSLLVESGRIYHKRKPSDPFSSVGAFFHHDNLPPQPQSGGNN